MFALDADQTEVFARATHLTTPEVTALTLVSLADRYPPLDLAFSGRQRQTHGIFVKENWVFSRASRYCPDCLVGDGSVIQQRHGGAWNLLWRLPVVFACTTHHRLLEHAGPGCEQPVHHRPSRDSGLLPLGTHGGLHPAQCRNSIPTRAAREGIRACGTRLDTVPAPEPGPNVHGHSDQVSFQAHLLDLLNTDGPTTIVSVGQDTTPAHYLVDLRLISCLITSSWPAARSLAENSAQAHALNDHVRHTRSQIARIRRSGMATREIAFYDKPPLESAACAHLLLLADRITAAGNADTVRELVHALIVNAPSSMPIWLRQFLAGNGYCSSGLQAALGPEVRSRHVMKSMGVSLNPRTPPPQAVRFGIQHIPQHLLPEWHAKYLARIADVKPNLLRRAAAARLAQVCVGGGAATAAELLGIPPRSALNALTVVKQQLGGRSRTTFNRAVESLTHHLNHTANPTDYGKRRDALTAWSISPHEWDHLIAGIPEEPRRKHGRWVDSPSTDWGESKRILASIWIWVRVTHGEHIFAPPVRPLLEQPRPGGPFVRSIHTRWSLISTDHPTGHNIPLRERLDTYADQLAASIDNQ
jgi:hypothetical protein